MGSQRQNDSAKGEKKKMHYTWLVYRASSKDKEPPLGQLHEIMYLPNLFAEFTDFYRRLI